MKVKVIDHKVIVRIDKGEELVESIMKVITTHKIKLGSIIGIGATDKATIGLYDVKEKMYHSKELSGNFEIAPVVGNISTMNDEAYVHLHINLCDEHHHSYGGHLNKAIISATCECIIDVIPGEIDRVKDEKTGLNLLNIE